MISCFSKIISYKHYEAGAIHKEAVRELHGYKNPNWDSTKVSENVYLEKMDFGGLPYEKFVYAYREQNGIAGRYLEHSKNPKNETNSMCQALFSFSPEYINQFSREEQIEIFRQCYDFFRSEFPDVPILEAVIHFDETTPHLHINFFPVIEREHKKRGKERIFSTTLLMQGDDFFPKYQDRFYEFADTTFKTDFSRDRGSGRKHLNPKEYRDLTAEQQRLQLAVNSLRNEYDFWNGHLEELKDKSGLDQKIYLSEQIRDLQNENNFLKKFIKSICTKFPAIEKLYNHFYQNYFRNSALIDKSRQ